MAKIDLTTITGYEAMTPEQKIAALEGFDFDMSEIDSLRETAKNQKSLIDKYTGEIGQLKKQQNAKLTEEERKSKEYEDALKDMQTKYEELRKSNTIAEYMSKYLSLGFEKDLARETAEAMADGDMNKVFENLEKHKTEEEKKAKAEAARSMPKPSGKGQPTVYKTRDEIMKIKDPIERQEAIAANIELFE